MMDLWEQHPNDNTIFSSFDIVEIDPLVEIKKRFLHPQDSSKLSSNIKLEPHKLT